MKEYLVRYNIGAYIYESVVRTSSSNGALLWAESIGGSNPVVVGESYDCKEKELASK